MSEEINFVEVDSREILNKLISDFEAALGETFYPGDERRIFIEQEAQVIVALYNSLNDIGRQNLLRYARGEVLDAIGERTDTPRLPAQKAKVTLRFTLSDAQPTAVTIPAGTRATPDGKLYFATIKDLIIASGETYGDVQAESTEAGDRFNGFTPGQINQIVDPVAFVASVANTDTSSGGADIEADDDGINVWSGYRGRIRDSVNKYSTAGPEDAYVYWAKTADANIQDVKVTSPAAGQVKITVLMKDGEPPTQTVLDKVLEVCSNKKVRPLTDLVTTAAPAQETYNIIFTYYISQDNAAQEAQIKEAIEGQNGAVDQYKAWQNSKLGRSINPDYLRQLVLNAGANRIDITEPVHTEVDDEFVASIGEVNITYGGLI